MSPPDGMAIALRLALYVDLMLLFGLPLFGLYGLRGTERVSRSVLPLRPLLLGTTAAGLVLTVGSVFMLASAMSGQPLTAVDGETISLVLSTSNGTALQFRAIFLILAAYVCWRTWRRPTRTLTFCSLYGGASLATLAWSGHGTMGEGVSGWVHLGSDIVHLLAAGAWIGAIVALLLLLSRRTRSLTVEHVATSHRSLATFSVVGTICVALILLTGLINSWILIGPDNFGTLVKTTYGLLLLAKLVLFGAMLGLAAFNRFRLTPALDRALADGDHHRAIKRLRVSLATEAGLAAGVLALVAWLGLLSPTG